MLPRFFLIFNKNFAMFGIFKKRAEIIETDLATQEVTVQSGFNSINQANAASTAIIASQGGIVLNKETNDDDGVDTTFIVPVKEHVWHEKLHIVQPEEE